ncbi:MAG: hypothetical protein EXS15_04845 [Phycisphaerales bacterium]|nr:hypothetical protein [Phycisphaerales bacterium]
MMRSPHSLRAFTLIEVIISTIVTTLVAGTVVAIVGAFSSALAIQDLRSEAIVRGAGVQSHIGLLSLKTRMTLALSPQRVLLWLPAETLEESGSGSDSAFDRIDLDEDELHWLEFFQEADASWTLIEWTVKPETVVAGAAEVYFSADSQFWDTLFVQMRDAGQLRRSPIAGGLAAPQRSGVVLGAPCFVWQTESCCDNRSVGAEFAFVAVDGEEELRSDMRLESALAFFDRHPICTES